LLAVAVGRARRLGRGGEIITHLSPGLPGVRGPLFTVVLHRYEDPIEIPILNPELANAQRILEALEKLSSKLHEIVVAEGRDYGYYKVKLEPLPLELQIALKKVVEAIVATALNAEEYEGIKEYIASLLVVCDPRAVKVEARVDKSSEKYARYLIFYLCKSHTSSNLELRILIDKYSDELRKLTWYGPTLYAIT
jgi:hypothetical protein